jgi:transcriptional regulator with XRE-family HTH domain
VHDLDGFYARVGKLIREARKRRGVTQEGLATLVSLSRTSLTNIERGRQKVQLHTLCRLAASLELTPDSLLPKDVPELPEAVASHSKSHQGQVAQAQPHPRRKSGEGVR